MNENAEPDAIILRAEYERLIACREVLAELVALRDDIGVEAHWHSDEDDWIAYKAAWERARAALERKE